MNPLKHIARVLAVSLTVGLATGVLADDDWVVLDGNYTLEPDDPKCLSGSYEVGWELQPKDGVVIDGSNWHVKHILAFQQNNISMTLKSGTLIIDHGDYNGCYPNSGWAYVNIPEDSTATVTMPFPVGEIYSRCFSQGNFKVNNSALTEAEFGLKIACEAVDGSHTRFSLREGKATDVAMTAVSLAVVQSGVVDASVTFAEDGRGDGNAQLYVVWDLADRGTQLSAWPNQVAAGTVGQFAGTERLSDLPERTRVSVRFIAVVSEEESFSSPCESIFSLYLEEEDVEWPGNAETDVSSSGRSIGFDMSSDRSVRHLELNGGAYVFPGKKELSVYDGITVNDAFVQFHGRIANQSDYAVFAFTNAFVQYLGTNNDNGDPNPFSTGGGQWGTPKNGVRIEMVNTTGEAGGMRWDAMQDGIKIGDWSSYCSLLVDGGGVTAGAVVTNMYYNRRGFHLGDGDGACYNTAVLRGGAELWDEITVNNAENNIGSGVGAAHNRLDIEGGEGFVTKMYKGFAGRLGKGVGSDHNVVCIDGKGTAGSAVWDNRGDGRLYVGSEGAMFNEMILTNGGWFTGCNLTIGDNTPSNRIVVTGVGSQMAGGGGNSGLSIGPAYNGGLSEGNELVIENDAQVSNFLKWETAIGGDEANGASGTVRTNGVTILSGGKMTVGNTTKIGQVSGVGSVAEGNYLHVSGSNSLYDAGYHAVVYVGQTAGGATARGNEIVVTDGGRVQAGYFYFGRDVSAGDTVTGNRIVARSNGVLLANQRLSAGYDRDDPDAPAVTDNLVLAEEGGVLEAKEFVTYSGNGNAIIVRNGGVMQFFERDPIIKPFEEGAIVLENGVLSYHVDVFDVNNIMNSTRDDGIRNLTVRGHNALRMNSCANTTWENQTYEFGETDDPRHFVRLEMVDGTTRYCGKSYSDDTLTIGATGSMLCSNTTATVEIPLTLSGPLSVVNSSLTLTTGSTLDAPVTLVDATLDLPDGTTLGDSFALTVGGELEDGRDVITSVEDLAITATMPANWRLRKRATDAGFAYCTRYVESGFSVIVR